MTHIATPITRTLALKLFEGFSIQRWTDRLRPLDLNEMDKSSHKMMLAYIIAKGEEAEGNEIDWEYLIQGGIFAFLKNIVLSDIKSEVHAKIRERKLYPEVDNWVVSQYSDILDDDLIAKFKDFLENEEEKPELRILKAAHKLATSSEFKIIQPANSFMSDIDKIKRDLDREIQKFEDITTVKRIVDDHGLTPLLESIEKLRFQTRWSQTQRIPKTSVLGHSLFVAIISYLLVRAKTPSKTRLKNAFFCALFHDLPESVTRDIIAPVKYSTKEFPKVIKDIESEIVSEILMPSVPDFMEAEIKYYTEDEFEDRIQINDKITFLSEGEIDKYDDPAQNGVDGKLLKAADHIAALIEADQSIEMGVVSHHLTSGLNNMLEKYLKDGIISNIDLRPFFIEFIRVY